MSQAEAVPIDKLIYLRPVALPEICFLPQILYWVAFGRLPDSMGFWDAHDDRGMVIEGFCAFNDTLDDDECKRADPPLPPDPRSKYDWTYGIMLCDFKEIAQIRAIAEIRADESKSKELEAANFHKEISEWKPKYERAIELAATEIYGALRKGRLSSKGVRLPDPDLEVSLKVLAEQGKQLDELEDVAIPKDAWSLPHIHWEISAARNDCEHYRYIYCPIEEVLSLFPHDIVAGEPVDGLVRHGSFFVLARDSAAALPAAAARRSQPRGRGRGRPPEYRWSDLHLEMAAMVCEGLPSKKEAAVADLQGRCGKHGWSVPAIRTLRDFVTPYYKRFGGNLDR
jgi:hypothetical protein